MTDMEERGVRARRLAAVTAWLAGAALLVAAPLAADAGRRDRGSRDWRVAAGKLRRAARFAAKADYLLAGARALALPEDEQEDARDDAREEYVEERELAEDQYAARLELADRLGETTLTSVAIDPADFVDTVDNPYFPLTPGTTRTYRAQTEDGLETIVVSVLHETVEILGVRCTVVRDTVSLDGEVVEDTDDWFAQDVDGNVWYFGEISLNYEDGRLADVDGSWRAGVDGAQAGIVMKAAPAVGDLYRQEFLLGEAEDYGEVLALGESATVPAGTFSDCVRTFDGSALEPDAQEHKFYAPGIGAVLEVDLESGERVELVSVTTE